MSILDSIKGERKLSFNHWRYRILHWAFRVENPNPKNPDGSTGLPKFLYTHYCPLFHLTNLIALLSPLILTIRVGVTIFWALVAGCTAVMDKLPLDKIADWFLKHMPKRPSGEETPVIVRKRSPQEERHRAILFICDFHGNSDFGVFWTHFGQNFETLSESEVRLIFDEYMPKVEEARRRAEERRRKWRERIIFWTNFSRVFIKFAMNGIYIALAGGMLYGVYLAAPPVWSFLCWAGEAIAWLFTDVGSLSTMWLFAKVLFYSLLTAVCLTALIRSNFAAKFIEKLLDGMDYVKPPLYVLGAPIRWVKKGWTEAREFVAMFYEENCPPITLVSEEEAAVESVALDGEEV